MNMDGRIVYPGDILIGNGNGLVVFKPEDAKEIFEKVQAVMEKESHMMEDIEQNGHLDLRWTYQKIENDKCEIL